jgi:phenylacetate-CoA ligase
VKRLICIGEPVRDRNLSLSVIGGRLSDIWQARLFGTYASTEMATSFSDCCAGRGGHVPPELVLVEILDERGRPLPAGEPGEVVATPLQVTGMPLLRFRTGDIAVLHDEPCSCHRSTPRLGPVLGRLAQMLKVRGTTLFPQSIFSVLEDVDGIKGYYLEVFDEFDLSDRVRVVVGGNDSTLDAANLGDRLAARLRVRPEVLVLPPEEVQRKVHSAEQRKPTTFFDYRRQAYKGR